MYLSTVKNHLRMQSPRRRWPKADGEYFEESQSQESGIEVQSQPLYVD